MTTGLTNFVKYPLPAATGAAAATAVTTVLTNFEKYLTGEPLNEELAQLKAGLAERDEPALPARLENLPPTGRTGRLTRADKAALRELRAGPGWEALNRLVEIALQRRVDFAILLSQEDPLSAPQEIAGRWAYVKMLKTLWMDVRRDVEQASASVEEETEA